MAQTSILAGSALLIGIALTVGCSAATPPPTAGALAPTGPALQPASTATDILVPFRLHVDPATLTGSIEPATREAAGYQATLADLDPSAFLESDTLALRRIAFDTNGDYEFTFTFTHPFGAPDLALPPSATNRADLGCSGRLLILADLDPGQVATHTFFADVVVNPDVVVGADGYVAPGDLLAAGGFNTTAFPYVLLADELENNRTGVSNLGVMTGNYDRASGGWQRANLGSGDDWTGFDVVHQGQTITNTFTIAADHFADNGFDIDLALLMKYVQPKSISPKTDPASRFPADPFDPIYFAYRMPYGALDCSVLRLPTSSPLRIGPNSGETVPISIFVRDWDTLADEAGTSDLSDQPDAGLIQQGASSIPVLEFDCPELASTVLTLSNVGGNGSPGTELEYSATITNALGIAPLGPLSALVRATDPEAGDPNRATYHYGIDPLTLSGDPARAIAPVTYQAVKFNVAHPSSVPWTSHAIQTGTGQETSLVQLGTDGFALANVESDGDLVFVRTSLPNPASASDWTSHTILNTGGPGSAPSLAHLSDNTFAIAFFDAANEALWFALSFDGDPIADTDWTLTQVDTASLSGLSPHLAESVTGDLIISHFVATLAGIENHVSILASFPPMGPADWFSYRLGPADLDSASQDAAYLNGARPVVALHELNGSHGILRCAVAAVTAPSSESEWAIHLVDDTGPTGYVGDNCRLAVSPDGFAAIVAREDPSNQLRFSRALLSIPGDQGHWSTYAFTDSISPLRPAIAFSGDARPAIAYFNSTLGTLEVQRALVPSPTSATDWATDQPIAGSDIGYTPSLVAFPDGHLAAVFWAGLADEMHFARTTVPW